MYTTIPEEVVKKLFTSVTPVTITYAKKDMFDYLCYIKEFTGYNCPYWATLDFEESYFAQAVKFITECNDAYTSNKIKLYKFK